MNVSYIRYNPEGKIIMHGVCPKESILEPEWVIVVDEIVDPETHYVEIATKKILEKASKPSHNCRFDYSNKQWVLDEADAWKKIRMKRDNLLSNSDWRVMPDTPNNKKPEWVAYRQALRDITSCKLEEVVWPIAPT
jgi:hypothetical protein